MSSKLVRTISTVWIWGIFFGCFLFLLNYFIFIANFQEGGDIIEYFGITESILNHGSVTLTLEDQQNLSNMLNPGYFDLPGYYLQGREGERYPVHFVFYSFLLVPVRLVLRLLGINELRSLMVGNVIFFFSIVYLIWSYYLKDNFKRIVLLLLLLFSPFASFFIWPGPDMYYMSLVLLAMFAFAKKQYLFATVLVALASWHSQPLLILGLGLLLWYGVQNISLFNKSNEAYVGLALDKLFIMMSVGIIILVPYIYNYVAFGVWSPWTLLPDGWTRLFGFGLQNTSLTKLYEQLFDLNIGLFWYAPMAVLLGGFFFINKFRHEKRYQFLSIWVLLTLFFYQTNPAWHYGTAGYGPGRHGIFLLPILMFFIIEKMRFGKKYILVLCLILSTQLAPLAMNRGLEPDLTRFHYHTPLARWVLDNIPAAYSPTPEIFVDRTNHTDLEDPSSAIYMDAGRCRKAYILEKDNQMLINTCGVSIDFRLTKGDIDLWKENKGIYINF